MVLAHISVDDIRRATVFWLFSCVFQCFLHSWACKISVICFFNVSGFSTLLRAIFSIAKDAEHLSSRLDSLIQDFGSLLKQAGASVLPSPLAMLDQSRVISVAFLRSNRLGNSLLQQTPGVIDGARVHRGYKLLERLTSYWTKMLQRIRNILQVAGRRCYNVSGTACKLLDEDVTTYQERLTSYWTKMLQRIRNGLQVAGQRCYNVSGNRDWQRRPQDAITPPPEPPRKPPAKKRQFQKWQQSCPSRGAVTKNMPWGVKSKQWMNQYLLADEAYGWKTFLANHCC